jgi:uncharacterized protein
MGFQDILNTLAQTKTKYNIPELYLFGSFTKHQENENRNVDIVQLRERMNPLLKKIILKEGVRV